MEASFQEHLLILDAVMAGDGDRAEQAMQAHISRGGREFFNTVALMLAEPGD